MMPSPSIAELFDEKSESGRRLPAARVVEVVPCVGWAPVGKHPDETSLCDIPLNDVLWQVSQAKSRQSSIEHHGAAVADELAFDPNPHLAFPLLELPDIKASMGWQAQVDAIVGS
jgi:hypothetical protein